MTYEECADLFLQLVEDTQAVDVTRHLQGSVFSAMNDGRMNGPDARTWVRRERG
jgi:hypothetical protein